MPQIHNGYILHQGSSFLARGDITVIVTGLKTPSSNPKTGPMLQVWVIPTDGYPSEIAKRSRTVAHPTCGFCPLRDRVCYVNLSGVNQVYRSYLLGNYPVMTKPVIKVIELLKPNVRITAYGEAPAAPFDAFEPLIEACNQVTGYTHLWGNCDDRWRNYLMASVESTEAAQKAQSMGWKTFRILRPNEPLNEGEIYCKNHVNPSIQCDKCLLCGGANSPHSIAIPVHGRGSKNNRFILNK